MYLYSYGCCDIIIDNTACCGIFCYNVIIIMLYGMVFIDTKLRFIIMFDMLFIDVI